MPGNFESKIVEHNPSTHQISMGDTLEVIRKEETKFRINVSTKSLRVWRCFVSIYSMVVYILFIITRSTEFLIRVIKNLSQWGFLLTTVYFVLAAVKEPEKQEKAKTITVSTIFFLAFSFTVIVVLSYWGIVEKENGLNSLGSFYIITLHIHPLIFLAIDFIINRLHVFTFSSVLTICVVFTSYILVNIVFTFVDKPVYPQVTWLDVKSYIFTVGLFVMGISVFFILRCLSVLKKRR